MRKPLARRGFQIGGAKDELVMFARQLSDDRFEGLLSFMQSLNE
jgi:hypothetical protein